MSASEHLLHDDELRDLLKHLLMEGEEGDSFTETLTNMEQQLAFAPGAPLIPVPLGKEAELMAGLNKTAAAAKIAGKAALKMKWLFGGLGGVCVATGITYYATQQPSPDQPHVVASTSLNIQDTAAESANKQTDSLVHTPIATAPEVTKQPQETNAQPLEVLPVRSAGAVFRGFFQAPESPELPNNTTSLTILLSQKLPAGGDVFEDITTIEGELDKGSLTLIKTSGKSVRVISDSEKLKVEQDGATLRLEEKDKMNRRNKSVENDETVPNITIEVPKGTIIRLKTGKGHITATGMKSEFISLLCSFGNVTMTDCDVTTVDARSLSGNVTLNSVKGTIKAASSFGDLKLNKVSGPMINATSTSGNLSGNDLEGNLVLHSGFGNLTLLNSSGKLHMTATSGNLVLEHFNGSSCIVDNHFGDCTINDIQAPLNITATSGKIDAKKCKGTVIIVSNFGDTNLEDIRGNLTVNATSGDIELNNIIGNIRAMSNFGDLSITHSEGDVSLEINSGSVEADDVLLNKSLQVRVNFGDCSMKLRNDYKDIAFRLESTHGKVKINKGNMNYEKENGLIVIDKGTISVRGNVANGNISFR